MWFRDICCRGEKCFAPTFSITEILFHQFLLTLADFYQVAAAVMLAAVVLALPLDVALYAFGFAREAHHYVASY